MPIEIRFENPIGVLHPSLRFEPGQDVRVTGTLESELGGWALPGQAVELVLSDGFTPMTWSSESNLVSNYYFDITLPYVQTRANVRVTTYWPFGKMETDSVTIGIGVEPPIPPIPFDWMKYLPYILIGGAALVGLVLVMRPRQTGQWVQQLRGKNE